MKTRLFSILMAAMLLLCACSSAGQNSEANLNETGDQETIPQTGAANTVNTESTVNTVEPDGTTVTTEGSTEPATVPLVPDDTGYTGPTFNASENVGDWGDAQTNSTENTTATTPPATVPQNTQPSTEPATEPSGSSGPQLISYEEYLAMSTAQKQDYFLSFRDPEAFYNWLEPLEEAYEATRDQIDGGVVDISTVPTGN